MFSADPSHWGLRPVVTTTLAIDYALGSGLNPFWFQMDTFIWFIVLGVLQFYLYRNLLTRSIQHRWAGFIAFGAIAWYMLHTANAETVNYVIARSDVLSTLCIVASLLIYVSYPEKRKTFLYIIPAILGVFAKETVLVEVILLFFYILLFENELAIAGVFKKDNLGTVWKTFLKVLPLLVVVALVQYYTLSKVKSIPGITNPYIPYVLTQSWVWVHYFLAFFLPLNLSADTDWSVITNIFDERILIGLLFVVLLVIAIFKTSSKKETRPIAFGLIWFAASLLPTSLAPFAEVTNDHRMFFAFVGLCLSVVTWIGLMLIKYQDVLRANPQYKNTLATCAVLVLGLNAWGIHERNKVWHDNESLWLDVTQKSPLNGRGLMNYGLTQMEKGNYPVAGTYFDRATQYLPYYSTLYINIGILKGATGHPVEAETNFNKAIALSPATFDPYAFYARYLFQSHRDTAALAMDEKALQLNPYSGMVLDVMMACYNDMEDWAKLTAAANKKLALVPNDPLAMAYLAAAHDKTMLLTDSFGKVIVLHTAAEYLNQSVSYYNSHDYKKCIEACREVVKLNPNNADAYSNMGAAYSGLQQWQQAIDACKKALQLNPNHQLAKGNLDWAEKNLKK
jgi:tetratricopeptide (TPR) repeat protein